MRFLPVLVIPPQVHHHYHFYYYYHAPIALPIFALLARPNHHHAFNILLHICTPTVKTTNDLTAFVDLATVGVCVLMRWLDEMLR